MVVDGKLRFWRERNQLFFVFEFPLHFRAVFGGELRADEKELCRFVNFYNIVKPHRSLNGDTPFEVLQASLSTCSVNNATISYN